MDRARRDEDQEDEEDSEKTPLIGKVDREKRPSTTSYGPPVQTTDAAVIDSDTVRVFRSSIESSRDTDQTGEHCHSKSRSSERIDKVARRKLILASVLCLTFMIAELVGGVLASSLAIATDAAHLMTDFASFMISLFSLVVATRPATKRMSFGWYRAEVMGALLSVLLIWVVTGILFYMAVQRVVSGNYEIDAKVMLITAGAGVAFNILMGMTLHDSTHGHSHGGGSSHSHSHTPHSHNVSSDDRSSHSSSSSSCCFVETTPRRAGHTHDHNSSSNSSKHLMSSCEHSSEHREHSEHVEHAHNGAAHNNGADSNGVINNNDRQLVESVEDNARLSGDAPTLFVGEQQAHCDNEVDKTLAGQHRHRSSGPATIVCIDLQAPTLNSTSESDVIDRRVESNDAAIVRLASDTADDVILVKKASPHHDMDNINVRAAFIHVVGDMVQSFGVLIAAYIIYYKPEWKVADPICTFVFSFLVLFTTITILRDILVVLMEGAPRGISFNEVKECLCGIAGVKELHNLRLWSLTVNKTAMSVHLALDKNANAQQVLAIAGRMMHDRFGVYECTVQIENYVDEMGDCVHCKEPND